jgi:uncharacterized membrane protein
MARFEARGSFNLQITIRGMNMTVFSSAPPRGAHPTVRAAVEADRSAWGRKANVGEVERWICGIAGAALVARGLTRPSLGSLAMAAVGGSLLYRGATGYCGLYDRLGISTADVQGRGSHHGILVKRSVTVNRPVEEAFAFWRDFENLPRFLRHLKSVKATDATHSHWVARGPIGMEVEWDAEVFNEKPNELIAWRSLEGSEVDHAGSVRFRKAPADRGTEVLVELNYEPPGGRLGASIAWLFGEEPRIQIEDDLRRFKQVMETGEIATVDGQPKGH